MQSCEVGSGGVAALGLHRIGGKMWIMKSNLEIVFWSEEIGKLDKQWRRR